MSNYDPRPEFDEKDKVLLKERATKREKRKGPEVGDFVLMPSKDGVEDIRRLTHDWGDSIQTTVSTIKRENGTIHPCAGDASFYIDRDGYCNFSGSLDSAILKSKMTKKRDSENNRVKKSGNVWFFHHDSPGAGRGVYCTMMFTVWEYKP